MGPKNVLCDSTGAALASYADAAILLGVTRQAIAAIDADDLPRIRIGGRVYFRVADLERIAERRLAVHRAAADHLAAVLDAEGEERAVALRRAGRVSKSAPPLAAVLPMRRGKTP